MNGPESKAAGALYVVGTPIGNPEDITLRALRVLSEVDWVAAEDTRRTRRLLAHHGLSAALISYYEHNEQRRAASLVLRLSAGETGALVCSAGTPTVSDPGYRLVTAAAAAGIAVVPVPGPSAAAAALSASGLATDSFVFVGFAPKKPKPLQRVLRGLASEERTLIFYESPARILAFLDAARAVFSDREAVLAREMTKPHEEFLRGRLSEIRSRLAARAAVKGECTLLVSGASALSEATADELAAAAQSALDRGMSVSAAAKTVADRFRVPKGRIYKIALQIHKTKGEP